MSPAAHTPQWPDDLASGEIRYGRANNYDGFYLADAQHGIPTFASVSETSSPTIRGQHVGVFNYPKQTERIAAQLCHRWNCHAAMLAALKRAESELKARIRAGLSTDCEMSAEQIASLVDCCPTVITIRAAIAKAEGPLT